MPVRPDPDVAVVVVTGFASVDTAVTAMKEGASDYLAIYERYNLSGARSVMAHNVHTTSSEIDRLADAGTAIAHCPGSNAALGSGAFPLRRHVDAGVFDRAVHQVGDDARSLIELHHRVDVGHVRLKRRVGGLVKEISYRG